MVLLNRKKQNGVIVPAGFDLMVDQQSEDDLPVALVRFNDGASGKSTVIALDPNAASALVNALKGSPLGMFMKTDMEGSDVMYA